MHPTSISIIGNELAVVWSDGHEAYYAAEALRRDCPCAHCAGEADLFGRVALPPPRLLSSRSLELAGAERVGNYGVQVTFGDGHGYGIWTFGRLRDACPCDDCRKLAAEPVVK